MKTLVSVIVPIYNSATYLQNCLNSLIDQSHTNLEIILVNDGSTDNSGKIAQSYAKKDNRICYIEQENKGAGAARNAGLEKARGEWICFVDSDDYVQEDYVLDMLMHAQHNELDYVHNLNAYWFDEDARILPRQDQIDIYSMTRDALRHIQTRMIATVWNSLFKKSIIDSVSLRFLPRLKHQDEAFSMCYLPFCKRVGLIKGSTYFYRQLADSAMGVLRTQELKSLEYIEVFCEVIAFYERNNLLCEYNLPFYLIRGRGDDDCFCHPRFKNAHIYFSLAKSRLSSYQRAYFQNDALTLAIIKSPHIIAYRLFYGYYHRGFKGALKALFRLKLSKKLKIFVFCGWRFCYKDRR